MVGESEADVTASLSPAVATLASTFALVVGILVLFRALLDPVGGQVQLGKIQRFRWVVHDGAVDKCAMKGGVRDE